MVDHDRQGVSGEKISMAQDCRQWKCIGGGKISAIEKYGRGEMVVVNTW